MLPLVNIKTGRAAAAKAAQGSAGYDNPRDNIDPHVKTQVVSTKELNASKKIVTSFLSGSNIVAGTISGANIIISGAAEVAGLISDSLGTGTIEAVEVNTGLISTNNYFTDDREKWGVNAEFIVDEITYTFTNGLLTSPNTPPP